MILWGGKIITMDPRKPAAQAVAIKNGRFLKVGGNEEVQASGGDQDPEDCAPGTDGDARVHRFPSASCPNTEPTSCRSIAARSGAKPSADIKRPFCGRPSAEAPGEWIRGVGYDDTKIRAAKVLTRRDLDEVAPDHPVFIQHVSGHWAVVNSKALEIGGVREDAPDPKGGAYGRDPGTGRLNGILYEQAEFAFVFEGTTGHPPIIPPFSLKERMKGLRLAVTATSPPESPASTMLWFPLRPGDLSGGARKRGPEGAGVHADRHRVSCPIFRP